MYSLISLFLTVQLAKIDRYEFRLMSMAYMGNFDELLNSAQPVSMKLRSLWAVHNLPIWPYPPFLITCGKNKNSLTSYKKVHKSLIHTYFYKSSYFHFYMQQIDAVLSASFSAFRSSRLKKVFEVITGHSLVSYMITIQIIIHTLALSDHSGLW